MRVAVTVLGCGGSTGVPSLGGADGAGEWGACDPRQKRNIRSRSSVVVHAPLGNILIDTGPDLRTQILANRIPKIDAIFYTHAHADHLMGFDDIRLLNRVLGRPIPAYGDAETLGEIRRRFDYALRPWQPPHFFWPVLEFHEIEPFRPFELCGLRVEALLQDHQVMRSLGLQFGNFAYSTDWVRLPPETLARLEGLGCWLCGCFQRAPHPTHAHVELVVETARRLGVAETWLTHMGIDLDYDFLRASLPAGFAPAHDGLLLEVTV